MDNNLDIKNGNYQTSIDNFIYTSVKDKINPHRKEKRNFIRDRLDQIKLRYFYKNEQINLMPFLLPISVVYLNFHNWVDILSRNIYSNDLKVNKIIQEVYKFDYYLSQYNRNSVKSFYLALFGSFYSIFKSNFDYRIMLSKTSIYCLSYYSFLYKFKYKEKLKLWDYLQLFIQSSILTIPFNYYLSNLYDKKLVIFERNNLRYKQVNNYRFHHAVLMSLMDSFFANALFFTLLQRYVAKDQPKELKNNLNYDLIENLCKNNETFDRINEIYLKKAHLFIQVDRSSMILLMSCITALIYTPIEFFAKSYMSLNKPFLEFLRNLKANDNDILRSNTYARFKVTLLLNFLRFYLQMGVIYFGFDLIQ